MKQRVKEMEEEAAKLREMQAQVEKEMNLTTEGDFLLVESSSKIIINNGIFLIIFSYAEDKEAIDARSIYVGNVSYFGNFGVSSK